MSTNNILFSIISELEQVNRGSLSPAPVPLPNENKGLRQNFDVKVDEPREQTNE